MPRADSPASVAPSTATGGSQAQSLPSKKQRTIKATRGTIKKVPVPLPGHLLIYDCRPQHDVVVVTDRAVVEEESHSQYSATASVPFLPDTPTPGPQKSAIYTVNITSRDGNPSSSCSSSSDNYNDSDNNNTTTTTPSPTHRKPGPIRCLQWNIERNYESSAILSTLSSIDADILCLQEIDIGCLRSGGLDRDHFLEICQSQGLMGGFVTEFLELENPIRKDRDQGGGVHGNAILSKYPINSFRVLDHEHHAYEWEMNGMKLKEPRIGKRYTIVADIETPQGKVLVYSVHLEVFTGIIGRISAMSDILKDAEMRKEEYPYQMIFGDLNTISHSIARLAKFISTDWYRWGSFGVEESGWWDRNLWSWHVQDGEFNLNLASGGFEWIREKMMVWFSTKDQTGNNKKTGQEQYVEWLQQLVGQDIQAINQARRMLMETEVLERHQHHHHHHHHHHSHHKHHHHHHHQQQQQVHNSSRRGSSATTTSLPSSSLSSSPVLLSPDTDLLNESMFLVNSLTAAKASKISTTLPTLALDNNDHMNDLLESPVLLPSYLEFEKEVSALTDHQVSSPSSFGSGSGLQSGSFSTPGPLQAEKPSSQRMLLSSDRSPGTPSPSPTLQLIPPTPNQDRTRLVGAEEDHDVEGSLSRGRKTGLTGGRRSRSHSRSSRSGSKTRSSSQQERSQQQQQRRRRFSVSSDNEVEEEQEQEEEEDEGLVKFGRYISTRPPQPPYDYRHHYHSAPVSASSSTLSMTDSNHNNHNNNDTQQQQQQHPLLQLLKTPLTSGFTPLVLHQARNPGFYDPWSSNSETDKTLHNPAFFGLLSAKLDYTFLKNLNCQRTEMGNLDYKASDHRWLMVEVDFEREWKVDGEKEKKDDVGDGNDVNDFNESHDKDTHNDHDEKLLQKEQEQQQLEYWRTTKWAKKEIPSQQVQYRWWRSQRIKRQQHVEVLENENSQQTSSSWFSGTTTVLMATAAVTAVAAVIAAVAVDRLRK